MTSAELIEEIKSNFDGVSLGDGIGLFEADAIDNNASKVATQFARIKDRELWTNWREIPSGVIARSSSALCFADIAGMRFLLPAFMVFALENYQTSDSLSVDSPIYALLNNPVFVHPDMDQYFSPAQYALFSRFLRFMALDVGEDFVDAICALEAYDKFWAKYDAG